MIVSLQTLDIKDLTIILSKVPDSDIVRVAQTCKALREKLKIFTSAQILPTDILLHIVSKALPNDIYHAAQTCKEFREGLSPLLKRRRDEVHLERCNDFYLAFFNIAKHGVDTLNQFERLRDLASNFDPRPLRDDEPVKFFSRLFTRACRLCATPNESQVSRHTTVNDQGMQQLFSALSVFANKLPIEQRRALFEDCLKQSSDYVFMSILSKKLLMLQEFLLHLVALIPNESEACEALDKVLDRFSGRSFGELEKFLSIEAFLTHIDGIKDESRRFTAVCKLIEKYPAHSMDQTGVETALDCLAKTIASFEVNQHRYAAVCKLIEHYPASSRWPEEAFKPWQRLTALKTLLKTAAGLPDLSDLQMRGSALHKIIETASIPQSEPDEAAQAIKAMLAAADTLTNDQERLNLMNAIMMRHRSDIPWDETEAVVSSLMTFSEGLSGAAQRESAVNSIQRSFPKTYEHLLAERVALEVSPATL